MKFSAGNAQHIGAREQQQDSFGFSDPSDKSFVRHGGFLGVVADGMGGLANGREASATAVRSFLAAYQAKPASESVVDALSRSLGEANQAVRRIVENGSANDAGTTLAAAAVLDRELYWIAAGDSRIYWLHDDELTQLTADHTYAAMLNRQVALGKISRSEAENHPERASLTSYLGQSEPAFTDRNLKPLLLGDGDGVVLCSDGFYRALASDEIVNGFRGNPQHACDSLVEFVVSKGRKQQDNLTVIALKSRKAAQGFARISRRARILLVAAACMILLSIAAGFWFGRHGFVQHPPPAAASPTPAAGTPPKPQPPGAPASKPNTPVNVTASPALPPPAKPPVKTVANGTASQLDNPDKLAPTRPLKHGATPHQGRNSGSHAPTATEHHQITEQPALAPDQTGHATTGDAGSKPSTPPSSLDTSPTPRPDTQPPPPPPATPPSSSPNPQFARPAATWIPLRGDHSHGFPD